MPQIATAANAHPIAQIASTTHTASIASEAISTNITVLSVVLGGRIHTKELLAILANLHVRTVRVISHASLVLLGISISITTVW